MVTIRYYKSATAKEFETHWVNNVGVFLKEKDFPLEQLLDLRFFKGDVLGEEIDTINGYFLDITEGEIEIFHGNTMPGVPLVYVPYIVAALSFVAAIVLAPDIPNLGNQKQRSSTNKLGASNNEANVNGRTDDIFGTVTKHTPPLWQVPYRIGVDNQETEVLLMAIGRGKYDIDTSNIYDGFTPYEKIPKAQVSIYEPGKYPDGGTTTPDQSIGATIEEPIGIYRESNDLNASELLPPNDLTLGEGAIWSINETGTSAVLTLDNAASLEVDLTEYFIVTQDLKLIDTFVKDITVTATTTLYRFFVDFTGTNDVSKVFNHITAIDISGEYEITARTATTVTIDTVAGLGIGNAGVLLTDVHNVTSATTSLDFNTIDSDILSYTWYETFVNPIYSDPITQGVTTTYNPDVGQIFDNTIGPITIYGGSDKILINLTSASGFYKKVGTNNVIVSVDLEFVVEDLDSVATTTTPVTYTSNRGNITKSVYQTVEIPIPYTNATVYGRRLTNRDLSDGVSNVDKVEWTLLYSFTELGAVDFGDVTLMHCVIPSNSQSRLIKQRKTNLDVTRKITQYLGGDTFGPAESYATDDFSQILIHTALDPKIGRLSLDQINQDGFISLATEIQTYFSDAEMIRFGYDFDTVEMSYEDMFTMICNAVNCIPYAQNGVYDAFFEKAQTTSAMQITCRNKIVDTETREDIFFKEYDGVELSFRNELTGVSETVYNPSDRTANNPDRQELLGCVTEVQATKRAARIRNKQIYNTVSVEFDTDEFGRMIIPGQRIDSPDGTRFVHHTGNTDGYYVYSGEVVEVNGLVVELSEPVEFRFVEDHYIYFTNTEGENSEMILCTAGANDFEVILATTPAEAIYEGYARDKTKFTFCSEQLRESIALIPQTIEFKLDDGKETNTISSINYSAMYYDGDLI